MIKIATRRNLIYPLQLLIYKVARDAEIILIEKLFDFKNSLIFTSIMFLAEIFAGLIAYKYEAISLKKKKFEENTKHVYPIKLIQNVNYFIPIDNNIKIFFLIFVASLSDYIQFIIRSTIIPKFLKTSATLHNRLGGFIILLGAFFYLYALKIPIFKHHIFTLVIISVCLIIIIVLEFLFQEINIFLSYGELFIVLLIILVNQIFDCLLDTIEKYLFEYDFANPLKVLMFEGFFGSILSYFYFWFLDIGMMLLKYKKKLSTQFCIFNSFVIYIFYNYWIKKYF